MKRERMKSKTFDPFNKMIVYVRGHMFWALAIKSPSRLKRAKN